ncbi:hypothetical protein FMEXI_1553 [Fusarium mexicanum]|uniref:Uncharacterized protein n=1 Tax=Fusarium mexicanum TaxID=751941 RepID=A0A8H5N7C2_9HYPO|nr:hypothetical protein FMEXI_1553 [Fusarium mexicanum]
MGFWSSLVNSATHAVHWVSNNAGNIGDAAKVVAGVIGAAAMTEDELAAEGNNILPTFYSHIVKAEGKLLDAAKDNLKSPVVANDEHVKTVDLPGLWPSPGGTIDDPAVIPGISIDINKLLVLKNIPNNLKSDDGQVRDVGESIANQIFNFSRAEPIDKDSAIFKIPVEVLHLGKPFIGGGMVAYKIPLGNAGSFDAWHSHVRLHYIYDDAAEKKFREEKLALAIKPSPTNIDAAGAYNLTTISAQWNGSRGIAPQMTAAVQKVVDDAKGKVTVLSHAVNDGTRFKYQFRTAVSVGPAQVASQLSTALSAVLPDPTPENPLPRMPTIKVSNVQTYI